jgi:2-methylcitrate dehydratase PrpD
MTASSSIVDELQQFILRMSWDALSDSVRRQAKCCLLDTLGAALAARGTEVSRIIHDYAAEFMQGGSAALWQDGRTASPAGDALANGITIDALDIHDGHSFTKGHAGVAVVPTVLASVCLHPEPLDGKECLTAVAIGYEVSLRDGTCLHNNRERLPFFGGLECTRLRRRYSAAIAIVGGANLGSARNCRVLCPMITDHALRMLCESIA